MKKSILSLLAAGIVFAQSNAVVDHYTTADLTAIQEKLAASHLAFKSEALKTYKGHYSMLAHRGARVRPKCMNMRQIFL